MKRARQMLKRLFGKLREQKEDELGVEYLDRVQNEDDRSPRFMAELREMLQDHAQPDRED